MSIIVATTITCLGLSGMLPDFVVKTIRLAGQAGVPLASILIGATALRVVLGTSAVSLVTIPIWIHFGLLWIG